MNLADFERPERKGWQIHLKKQDNTIAACYNKNMKIYIKLITGLLVVMAAGCSEGTRNIINVAESRRQMVAQVKNDEYLYNQLKEDARNNSLVKGTRKKEIIAKYGEPTLTKPDFILYRHPTDFFSSDLVYLYFDRENKLTSWEIRPVK